ncbi:hypothetical protein BC829DRAFT_443086 [Chytridium lagenaria]|nr:hypothetical protein BC829DRAFT_443086 [Chytridium lagenaria]
MTTRAKMAAKTGIPENARLFQIKAGRDLPSIKERSNGIISEFRATCAIFQVPICQENLTRFIRNQNKGQTELSDPYLDASECKTRGITVLDPRATAGQHQKRGPSRQERTVVASSGSRHPGGVSKDEDRLSHLHLHPAILAPIIDDEVVRVFSDDEHTSNLRKLRAGFEPASSEHMTNKGKEPLPIIAWGSLRDQAIRQRAEGSLDPRILITRRRRVPPAPLTPPACFNPADDAEHGRSCSNSYPKTERTLGSNRYNIDLVFHLVQRLGDLGVEVTINEGRLKSNVAYRNERLESLTSLVDERRKRLYKTINGARDMLVDSTNELAMLMGCGAFNIRQLDAATEYTDAALVAVRHDLTSCLVNSQMKVKEMRDRLTTHRHPSSPPAPAPVPLVPSVPTPRALLKQRSQVRLPQDHPLNNVGKKQLPLTSLSSVDGDSLTDTTTSSVGSASDDDDHTDPRQVAPVALASRRKAPRHPLSRYRVHGLANTKHLTSDVEGITKKLTLLQYRELRSGSSTTCSRPPLPLLRSADADVGNNTPLVDSHAPKVLTKGSNASSADPAAAIPLTALPVGVDEPNPVNDGELIEVDDSVSPSSTPPRSPSPTLRDLVLDATS